MASWRDVLRQRQLDIDAADKEELEAKKKPISASQESVNSNNSSRDVSMLSSPCTAPAAVHMPVTDVPDVQSPTSDDLLVRYEYNMSEQPTTYISDVENSAVDHREAANDELSHQLLPADVAYLTDELKSDVDFASDGGSLTESDVISSGVIDSSKSLTSTPEHLVSAAFNCTSENSETHFADEVPKPLSESATSVDLALDIESPAHKRTRRHARRHGAHRAKRKQQKHAVEQVETKRADDHVTSVSDVVLSQQSDLQVIPDAAVTDGLAAQVVRHASYLKAVGVGNENSVTSQQQTTVTESTAAPASQAHSSSHEDARTASKYLCSCATSYRMTKLFLPLFFNNVAITSHVDCETNLKSVLQHFLI